MLTFERISRTAVFGLLAISVVTLACGGSSTAPTSDVVSPSTLASCLQPGLSLSVPTNSPTFIPNVINCSKTIVFQFLWQLPGGQTGAAYAIDPPGKNNFLPNEITGSSTAKPAAIFYAWFTCPQGYGPVLPGTTTPVSYSTNGNYDCRSKVAPSGYQLNNF